MSPFGKLFLGWSPCGKRSVEEQVRTFAAADVIVGATGAAFANIIFAKRSSRIYVLMAEHAEMPYFYWSRLASCMGQTLEYVLCQRSDKFHKGFHADFVISSATLGALIAQVCN
jgi:capsular polysaccharide biosynthesis protein